MKLRADLKLFAIGHRGQVELRVGRKPPCAITTTCPHEITVHNEPYLNYRTVQRADGNWVAEEIFTPVKASKKIIQLKSITWEGGRFIRSISIQGFRARGNSAVKPDTCREVPRNLAIRLLNI